jgi:hypothetical protein
MSDVRRSQPIYVLCAVFFVINVAAILYIARGRSRTPDISIQDTPVAPLQYRHGLVDVLQKESMLETADRLARFDDSVWVMGNIDPDTALSQRSYRYQMQFIPSLNRVRKLVDQVARGDEKTTELNSRLLQQFQRAVEGFDAVWQSKNQQVIDSPGGFICQEADEYWSSIVHAPTAAYLLSEFGVVEALPHLTSVLGEKSRLPVNRVFLYFSAHRLATGYPRDNLSPQSSKLLDEHLALTANLPGVDQQEVFSWDAPFEESESRFTMLRRDADGADSFKRTMNVYPASLASLDTGDGEIDSKLKEYIESLIRFVDSVQNN